jgi:hypothetical protein
MNTKLPVVLLASALLAACVAPPPPRPVSRPAPVNLTKVYFYPTQGQSEEQQDRDRYDCHVWATRQTGFDPTQQISPREQRAAVVPARAPGETVGTAAVVGAVLGAALAGPGNVGKGAVVGAMAGTVAGSAAAAGEQAQADAINEHRQVRIGGRYEKEAADYRRAMSACLSGRGYSVR